MLRRRRNRKESEVLSEDGGENSQKSQLTEFSDAEDELDLSYQGSSDDFTSDEGEANFQSCDESINESGKSCDPSSEKVLEDKTEEAVLINSEIQQSKEQCTISSDKNFDEACNDKLTISTVERLEKSESVQEENIVRDTDKIKDCEFKKSGNVVNHQEKTKIASKINDYTILKSEKLNAKEKSPFSKKENNKRDKNTKGKRNRERNQNKLNNKKKEVEQYCEAKQDFKVQKTHEDELAREEEHIEDMVDEEEDLEENGAPVTPRLGGFYQHDCSYRDPSKRSGRRRREFHQFEEKEKERWLHDKYSEQEQVSKTELELVDEYGYNIRKHNRGGRRKNFDGRRPNYQQHGSRNMRDYRDRNYRDNNRGYYDNNARHSNREHDLRQSHRDDVIRQLQQSATENQNAKVEDNVEDDLNTTTHSTHSNMTEENDGFYWDDHSGFDSMNTRFRKININESQQGLSKDSSRHKAEEITKKYKNNRSSNNEASERTVNIKDKQISVTVPNSGRRKTVQPKRYSTLRQQNNLPKNSISFVPKLQENQQTKVQSQVSSVQTNVTNQQKVEVNNANEHSEQQTNVDNSPNTAQNLTFQHEISKQINQVKMSLPADTQTSSQNAAILKKEDIPEKKQAFVAPQPQQNFQQIVNQVYIPRHHSNQQLANHLREIIALKNPTNENHTMEPPLQWHPGNQIPSNQLHSNQISSSLIHGSHLPDSLHTTHLPTNQLQNQLHGQQLHSNAPAFNMPLVGSTGEQIVGAQQLLSNHLLNNKMLPPQQYTFANQQAAQQLMNSNFTNFPPPNFGQFLTSSGQQGREFGGLTYFDCPPPQIQQQVATKLHHPKV